MQVIHVYIHGPMSPGIQSKVANDDVTLHWCLQVESLRGDPTRSPRPASIARPLQDNGFTIVSKRLHLLTTDFLDNSLEENFVIMSYKVPNSWILISWKYWLNKGCLVHHSSADDKNYTYVITKHSPTTLFKSHVLHYRKLCKQPNKLKI